jgi:hypothetical protein
MGSYADIANAKRGYMHADLFECILEEFPSVLECVKSLCRKVRRILVPLTEDGKLDLATPLDPQQLYDPIFEGFDNGILDIAIVEDAKSAENPVRVRDYA